MDSRQTQNIKVSLVRVCVRVSAYVCVYVCVYVCMYVCEYVCVWCVGGWVFVLVDSGKKDVIFLHV